MRFVVAVTFVLALAGCWRDAPVPDQEPAFPTWPELSKQLLNAVPEVLENGKAPHDYVFDVADARRIREHGTIDTWLEMCAEENMPMVAVAGFLCVQQRAEDQRFKAALTVMENHPTDASLYFYLPPMQFLHDELKSSSATFSVFNDFSSKKHYKSDQLAFTVSLVNEQFLRDWARTQDLSAAAPLIQAFAVGAVFADAKNNSTTVTDRIGKLLDSFAKTDDIRRVVFVQNAPNSVDRTTLKTAIIGVLMDDELPQMYYTLALMERVEFITETIDIDALKLTASQRERYAKIRKRHESKK